MFIELFWKTEALAAQSTQLFIITSLFLLSYVLVYYLGFKSLNKNNNMFIDWYCFAYMLIFFII